MKIILTGIQGSGKSTQGNLLSEKLKIPYLSTGHIFREMAKEKTQQGRYIKETLNAGFLIPDGKTIEIVNEYLSKPEYENGYILDGFPRTLAQAEAFKENITKVFYIKLSDEEALKRISGRKDQGREDDTLNALKRRIESFHRFTEPVIDFYRKKNILVEINGLNSIEEIEKEILSNLE